MKYSLIKWYLYGTKVYYSEGSLYLLLHNPSDIVNNACTPHSYLYILFVEEITCASQRNETSIVKNSHLSVISSKFNILYS